MKQTAVEWLFQQLWEAPKDKLTWHSILEKAKQMENKQTAVQWLVEKIQQGNPSFKFDALIRQAKQMEKEQIVDAYTECWMNDGGNGFHKVKEAESYYNETYGGQDE